MKKFANVSFFITVGFFASLQSSLAQDKVMLDDGTVLPIKSFTFDGRIYKVETEAFGLQTYKKSQVWCIGSSCSSDQKPNPPITTPNDPKFFAIHGSNTIGAELMPALLEQHAIDTGLATERQAGEKPQESTYLFKDSLSNEVFSVELHAHGSTTSFEGIEEGKVTIGMSSRRIKNKEVTKFKALGYGDLTNYGSEHVLALDGLAIIIHPNNAISSLSLEEIAKIFAGEITDWSKVGGAAGKINIYARDDKSGTYDTFKSLVLKPNKLKISGNAKRYESSTDLSDEVSEDKNGIGFIGFAYVRNSKLLALKSSCGMQFEASDFTVKTEEYPLARRLYLYTSGEPENPNAAAVLKTAMSDKVQPVINKVGFINQSITQKQGDNGKRLSAAIQASIEDQAAFKKLAAYMDEAVRASVTFRFNPNSYSLDNKAKEDIGRLARYLKSQNNNEIMLFGFADSQGPYQRNLTLSKNRAQVVADELANRGITVSLAEGFSELAPVACNKGKGLDKNRRVEVWIKK